MEVIPAHFTCFMLAITHPAFELIIYFSAQHWKTTETLRARGATPLASVTESQNSERVTSSRSGNFGILA